MLTIRGVGLRKANVISTAVVLVLHIINALFDFLNSLRALGVVVLVSIYFVSRNRDEAAWAVLTVGVGLIAFSSVVEWFIS